jgi:hypothetical protein
MEPTFERRTATRKPVRFQVKYIYLPPDANPPKTRTINMSTQGASIEALDPLQCGASIAFFVVTSEDQVIDVRAQVVYLLQAERPPYRAGIRFTHLSPTDRIALHDAIESAAIANN